MNISQSEDAAASAGDQRGNRRTGCVWEYVGETTKERRREREKGKGSVDEEEEGGGNGNEAQGRAASGDERQRENVCVYV